MAFFDAHCHLQDPRLASDLERVLQRADQAGVTGWAVCGTRESDWDGVLALARRFPGIVPMLGLHPWYAADAADGWDRRLRAQLVASGAGLGECGLDFALDRFDPAAQEAAFRAQVRLARDLDLPLAVHCRKAWERLLAIAREEALPAAGALVHSFSGSADTALRLQDLGFHLSFSCAAASPANRTAAKVLPVVAPDRLLLESDAPDLAPRHLEGWPADRPNEPANVLRVAEAVARLRNEPLETIEGQSSANARRLFGRWLP